MTPDTKLLVDRSSGYLLVAAAFFMPLVPAVAKICTVIVVLLWLLRGNPISSVALIGKNKPALALVSLFLIYLAGVAISTDTGYAWKDVLSKIPFLLVPLVFHGMPAAGSRRIAITMAFAAGTGLLCLVLLIRAIANYLAVGENYVFFYEAFSWKIHPTYLAIYISFGLLALLQYEHATKDRKILPAWTSSVLYFFGTTVLILSSARMGIIASVMATYFYVWHLAAREKSVGTGRLIFYGVAPVLLFLLLNYGINSASRFGEVKNYVHTGVQTDHGSIAARVKIWESSVELIRGNFWTGTGTGDVQQELKMLYERNGLHYALSKNLNAHNQFLQTLLATGIFGLLVLLGVLVIPFLKGWRAKEYLALSFLLIVALNSLTESILEREAGVLWFSFFYGLFFCTGGMDKSGNREL